MTDTYPRLLVASEFAPNASGGGPAVVRQMLKEWPTEKLSWWSCFPDRDTRFGQKTSAHQTAPIPGRLYPNQRWTQLKSWLMEMLWVPRATRHFQQTLNDLRPEVVWVIPHAWAVPPITKVLSGGGPGYHVTVQDYVNMGTYVKSFGAHRCQQWATLVDQLYARATTRDATSHPMVEDLQARTGAAATQMMHAGLEPEDFALLEKRTAIATSNDSIRIAYAGTIHTEREFAFFVGALERIRSELGREVSLHLYGSHSYTSRPWFDATWMQEHGNLPERELLTELRKCNWGFSPMSLQDDDPRYNRFSFPTKFITYLAAGLPVITLGHPENSVVRMATQYRVGLCSSVTDAEALGQQLKKLFSIPNPWQEFGTEVLRCARTEFDAAGKRQKLYECFRTCARSTTRAI